MTVRATVEGSSNGRSGSISSSSSSISSSSNISSNSFSNSNTSTRSIVSLLLLIVPADPTDAGSEDAMMGVAVTVKIASKRSLNGALIAPVERVISRSEG